MKRLLAAVLTLVCLAPAAAQEPPQPFGSEFPGLDSLAVGEWWKKTARGPNAPPPMDVPRDQVVAFAVYTHDRGILKMTAQLYPLKPDEPREARLEFQRNGKWIEASRSPVVYPGWSAHFRIEKWDGTQNVPYRVRHGETAAFEGLIRRDPRDKPEIVVASMSCNSSRTTGLRPEIIDNLKTQDPDLLFFAGDQTYRHTEHTAGWIEFGLQFRDVLRDRPVITIPDDHDVGHPNLWGENGKRSYIKGNADGGYFYPVEYVNLVQRQQTWHLPDPVDPAPIDRGITVYFTRLRVGGIDFAILEDRKFKTGPEGKIPPQGPRPDHINDPKYDPKSIDLPNLHLLGDRQHRFLESWSHDWTGAEMKAVLSQTAFCGAVHLHGNPDNRLLADLDCNGWPQTGRNRALEMIRRVWAPHLCGDQHLAVLVKHGITEFGDGPYALTSPALVNTIYGRWWHPEDEKPGPNPVPASPLPWTGDFLDGLGNKISMLAYANPNDVKNERERADGYGLVRFNKQTRRITFECWPRFSSVADGDKAQFAGWPITVRMEDNDGRKPVAWLPEFSFEGAENPVVEVIDEQNGDILYCIRTRGRTFQPAVYRPGTYTVKIGRDKPDIAKFTGLVAGEKTAAGKKAVSLAGGPVPPNIVILFADDLGYGDLGCYGHPSIRTPHLDRMAAEGLRFTDFYSAAEVCSPSRAALLTGRYPIRSGMCGDRRVLFPNSKGGLPDAEITIAEALKQRGYATGHIGKWHLGIHPGSRPHDQGFDESFGLPYSNDMDARADLPRGSSGSPAPPRDGWNVPLIRNGEIVERPADQTTLTKRYAAEAVAFIKKNKQRPFFLYLAHTMPHVPLFASPEFAGKSRRGIFGDTVEEIDWSVGQVLDTLRSEGLAGNTLVFFTSDNGPWLIQGLQGGSAGLLRDGKGSTFEGGMREPGIAWWPGRIRPGVTSELATTMDLFSTSLALAGVPLPADRPIDGIDLSPLLFDGFSLPPRPFLYYRGDKLAACRVGNFKAHFFTQTGYGQPRPEIHDPPLLYDLAIDPSERFDVAKDHPDVLSAIREAVASHQKDLVPGEPQFK
jgi:arylsulfatase A-like enzyme